MARILALVLLLPACAASMQMPPSDVSNVSEDEGIVIGSVLLLVEAGPPPDRRLTLIEKPERFKYRLTILAESDSPYEADFFIDVVPEEEAAFVTRMKAREYFFDRLRPGTGFGPTHPSLEVVLDVRFKVEAGKPLYIGRLVLHLPPALQLGETVRVTVENSREETLSETRKTHGSVVDDAVTALMLACDYSPSTVCMELAPRQLTLRAEPNLAPAPSWQPPSPPQRPPPQIPQRPPPPPGVDR